MQSANETLTDTVLEGLYKSTLQVSVQLQTVLALYDKETARNNGRTVRPVEDTHQVTQSGMLTKNGFLKSGNLMN